MAAGVDLILVFRTYLAPLLDGVLDDRNRPAIVIDVDDLDSDTQRRLGQIEEADRLERLESYYLPQADHVLTAAAADARTLAAREGLAAVTAVPNAVPLPDFSGAARPGVELRAGRGH